jgi:hypothetical protein
MMMQILDAAGMDMLTDKKREPDNNNPKGYYEFEPVKRLMVDKSWLPEASGKTVKIIAQLLPFLPASYNYKIIFMRRNMVEVLKSQQIMLGKEKEAEANIFPVKLNDAFEKQLRKVEDWIEAQANVEILNVNYADVVENPEDEFEAILGFLNVKGNVDKMKNMVSKKLYRNKIEKK